MKQITYPAWFTSSKGETAIFKSAEDVPAGWTSGAEKCAANETSAKPVKKQSLDL